MFAKHSFGVKYLGEVLGNPSPNPSRRRTTTPLSHPLITLSPMTAAFAPAKQLTFSPRTVDAIAPAPAPVERRHLEVVPATPELATVHRLPVVHRDEIYRRRRLVALAVLVGLVLGVASFVRSADATPTPEGQLAEAVTVIVQPGDTLWAIAGELDPAGAHRELVDRLAGLTDSATLQPGQQLVIPAHWLE